MTFQGQTYTIGAHFLCALINGDSSGLEDREEEQFARWCERATEGWEDSNGNKWFFTHADTVEDSHDEFGWCDVTNLRGAVEDIVLFFTCKQ